MPGHKGDKVLYVTGSVVLLLLIFISSVDNIFGMHEADHRYTVSGYVRDEQGNTKSDVLVVIEHKGGQKQQAKTDGAGYYETVFHLHDTNVNDGMVVTVGAESKDIIVAFDPEDKATPRGGKVDFGAKAKEKPLFYWFGIGGGGLLLCVAFYFAMIKRGNMLREKKQLLKKEKRKK